MADYCTEVRSFRSAEHRFGAPEVTYADMVSRGVYRAVAWAADTFRDWTEHRRAMKALDALERLDDRQLAELGITRRDLTVAVAKVCTGPRSRHSPGAREIS